MTILSSQSDQKELNFGSLHRATSWECPGNLSNLLDPFTSKPLIYHATASGFTVYSVGENGIDDGPAKSDKAAHILGLIIPGIRKVEYDDIQPDIVWSHND